MQQTECSPPKHLPKEKRRFVPQEGSGGPKDHRCVFWLSEREDGNRSKGAQHFRFQGLELQEVRGILAEDPGVLGGLGFSFLRGERSGLQGPRLPGLSALRGSFFVVSRKDKFRVVTWSHSIVIGPLRILWGGGGGGGGVGLMRPPLP